MPATPPIKTTSLIDERGVTALAGTTKARIERAALGLFVEKGVEAATTRDISAAAGVSEGALYRHFKGKEEIASVLFRAIHERLAALVREAGAVDGDLAAKTNAIVDAYCETADDDWALFSYHLLALARFLPTPPGADDPVTATEDIIADAMARGEIAVGDKKIIAAMALGVVQQTALHKVYGRLTGPMSAYASGFKAAITAILASVKTGDIPHA